MEWLTVGTIDTSTNYAFTPVVTGTLFKLRHISQSTTKNSLKVAIRQAIDDGEDLALFDYRLINCKVEQDILLFNLPQGLTDRRLAIKRVDNLSDDWKIEIQTLVSETNNMPAYPVSPLSNSSVNKTFDVNYLVGGVTPVVLSAFASNKVGTIITNKTPFNLYVSLGAPASFSVYDKVLGPDEIFEIPFNWCGEVYGICDIPDPLEPSGIVKVRDFLNASGLRQESSSEPVA